MADASFAVTNFTGGELCQYVQGNFTEPVYKTGLNLCSNAIPVEEGAWVRRPGTQFAGLTRRGAQGRVIGFDIIASAPYDLELTAGFLRVWQGQSLALAEAAVAVTSISAANPAVLIPGSARTWNTGDTVQVSITTPDTNYKAAAYLSRRQFVVTKIDTTHFSLADQLGNTLDGSQFALGSTAATVAKVLEIPTPWPDQTTIGNVRIAQSEAQILMFCYQVATQLLTVDTSQTPAFTLAAAPFLDGPYLDPPKDNSSVQASATSGTVTLTFSADQGLTEASEGQFVRLLSEPPPWVSGTNYSVGDKTTYNGVYYNCIVATGTTNPPDTTPASQAICPSAAQWCYAVLVEVASGTSTTATLFNIPQPPPPSIVIPPVGPLLYTHDSSNPIKTYRMGLYWGTKQPTNGTFHEGRFWFAGAVNNRADSGMANNGLVCSPTFYDGTPADNCGVSAVFNFPEQMQINSMIPNHIGIIGLCRSGEVLIQSSQLSDPITPTSIQAHLTTRYGSEPVEPLAVGYSTLFVNRYGKKLYDLAPNFFNSQRISAINVSLTGRHLTQGGLFEIRAQRELAPLVWARASVPGSSFIGMTYKREDGYGAAGPIFNGWHRHTLGGNRFPKSIATGTVPGGATDTLALLNAISPEAGNPHSVEFLTPIFQEGQSTLCAWQADSAIVPVSANVLASGGVATGVQFYGFWHGIGSTIGAYLGGLDCGDYLVASDGSITVPFGACGGLFTLAYYQSLASTTCNLANITYTVPTPPTLANPTILSMGTVSPQNDPSIADWSGRVFYAPVSGYTGLVAYSLDSGLVLASNATAISGSGPSFVGPDANGFVYALSASNVCVVTKYNSALAVQGVFGVSGSSLTDPTTQFPFPFQGACAVAKADANYIVNSWEAQLYVLNADTMGFAGISENIPNRITGKHYVPVTGAQSAASAVCYLISTDDTSLLDVKTVTISSGAGAYNPATWPTPNSAIAVADLGTVLPGSVDAGWTDFNFIAAIWYDQTDGNLIVAGGTSASTAHPRRIFKLNSASLAVMWTIAMTGENRTTISSQSTNTRIKYGTLAYYDTNGNVYCIDTIAGSILSTVAVSGISPVNGALASDDTTGDIMVYGSYTAGGGAPVPIGHTPNSYSSLWGRLDLASGASVGTQSRTSNFTAPGVIGFRFSSKGQLLRQQSPETSGARNGPAMGKIRRSHRASAYFVNGISGDVSFGTDFVTMFPQNLSVNGESRTVLQPFTGISRLELSDDYSFDSMIAWETHSLYPLAIAAVEGFLECQDL